MLHKYRRASAMALFFAGWPAMSGSGQTPPLPTAQATLFSAIQGNAVGAHDDVLADAAVRLRDVRTGRIVQVTKTDKAGLFRFRGVEPGSYVVELLDDKGATQATSQILHVNAGDLASVLLKLPSRVPPLAGALAHTAPSAVAVLSAAAAAGVLASRAMGQPSSAR